jgi:hypothetical protein
MQAIYQANIDELDENFLQGLKNLFRGKQIKLIVSEINEFQSEWNNLILAQQQSLSTVWNNEEDEVWNHVTSR